MTELLIPIIIFVVWTTFSAIFIIRFKSNQTNVDSDKSSFWNNDYIFDAIPSVFPTLGIFCTALGITIGIWNFNTSDIQSSIPGLLKGLRLAFIATMAGIIGLIVFQKIIAIIQKQIDNDPNRPRKQSDEISAIAELSFAIDQLKKENKSNNEVLIASISNDLEKIVAQKIANEIVELKKQFGNSADLQNANAKETIDSIRKSENAITGEIRELRVQQTKTTEKANKNTDEIIKAMSDNNKLISKKFDEFSDLLKKNNTEALVHVMQNATEQFNAQMSDLIDRLVKENFQELNDSVTRLNQWQVSNKEQIQKLTDNFQKTTELFSIASKELKDVAVNTKSLTDDNSKINQIVKELQKVMIDDKKFQEIIKNLTATIDTLSTTTDSFEETTNKLNDWVKTEKNFKESAKILIVKLDEFKDLNSDVWKRYREEMSSAVSIVKTTSKSLSDDLENINAEFYERLNDTLNNLDQCIQRFIVPPNRR